MQRAPAVPPTPRLRAFDSTLALRADPYGFASARARRLGSDVFETRLLLRPTIFLTGREAAALFYDPDRFVRAGAAPHRLRQTLFGPGAIQGTDGEEHRRRKALLLALAGPGPAAELAAESGREWEAAARRWAGRDRVVLYDEAREVLTRAVCAWAGVPLREDEVTPRTRMLTALFDGAGSVGPRHWRARLARKRADHWAAGLIEEVRAGRLRPPAEGALAALAAWRGPDGAPRPPRIAGVELLNLLRPTVAVAVYVAFVGVALARHPEHRARLAASEPGFAEAFVHEVRRFYPFFPSVVARVRRDFEWRGVRFPRGRRAILDLHGIDHDPRIWEAPEDFRPERFVGRAPGPYDLVPQGGGDHASGHRCAGEWATIELTKTAADLLARRLEYELPEQDLSIDARRLPALPRSRVVLGRPRLVGG